MLTRTDGDGRGGAALSMRAVTGQPIKFVGAGEKLDALDAFVPDRVAGRILGMGDVVALVEKAMASVEKDEAEALAAKIAKGKFDLEDMAAQFRQLKKMGDLKGVMAMLPGVHKIQKQLDEANIDPRMINRQEAIILSMTARRAEESRHHQGRAPEAYRGGRRRDGAGRQQAAEAVPADGRHDQKGRQDGTERFDAPRPGRPVCPAAVAAGRAFRAACPAVAVASVDDWSFG